MTPRDIEQQILSLVESSIEDTRVPDAIAAYADKRAGKQVTKTDAEQLSVQLGVPMRIRRQYGMTHVSWAVGEGLNPWSDERSILLAHSETNVRWPSGAELRAKEPAYFGARDERNASRKKLLGEYRAQETWMSTNALASQSDRTTSSRGPRRRSPSSARPGQRWMPSSPTASRWTSSARGSRSSPRGRRKSMAKTVRRSRGRKTAYPTNDVVITEPGKEPITLIVPTTIPSAERSDVLRRLYSAHVRPLPFGPNKETHWKGPCAAEVPATIADDVAEAMTFMGSIVDDRRTLPDGIVRLYSEGYWAHGF